MNANKALCRDEEFDFTKVFSDARLSQLPIIKSRNKIMGFSHNNFIIKFEESGITYGLFRNYQ